MTAVFLRVVDAADKGHALKAIIPSRHPGRFEMSARTIGEIPSSPFVYWASPSLLRLFGHLRSLREHGYQAMTGAKTNDDSRFLRLVWEVRSQTIADSRDATAHGRWARITRGGRFSPFYQDIDSVIDWGKDGYLLKAHISEYRGSRGWGYQWSANLNGYDWYFLPGLTWPLRGRRLSSWVVPSGCLPSGAGKMAYAPMDRLPSLLALVNSRPFDAIVGLFAGKVGGVQYEAGLMQQVRLPDLSPADEATLASLARRAWSLKRSLDTRIETSHAFILPALLQMEGKTLSARDTAWNDHVREVEAELVAIQAEIDERCFALYGFDEEDRRSIAQGFGSTGGSEATDEAEGDAEDEMDAEAASITTVAAELVSWAVGVAVGRFDVRLATGDRAMPSEPEPFDPLPVCSPGMLTGDDGLPLARPPFEYPILFPEDGILVDDPGHPRDITAAVRAVFDAVFGLSADAFLQEAAALVDPRGHDLRRWLASGFFEHHLKRHSKSRRKAPTLWQLGVASGRYCVWGYAHRLTRDSLFAIQNDVVAPKLAHEERRLSSLLAQAGPTASAHDRAEIVAQEEVVDEIRTFVEELRRVAPLWNPDLDDGIVLVMAPLWRLSPHKVWQKELKGRWDKLVAGKYDWAHLAMHLWPERVLPKCATDRSLAIAHDLEDVFWVEDADGKRTARTTPTRSLEDLIAERTSPAVKAALLDLLRAPGLGGSRRKRRR
jgi:hypothetical protein